MKYPDNTLNLLNYVNSRSLSDIVYNSCALPTHYTVNSLNYVISRSLSDIVYHSCVQPTYYYKGFTGFLLIQPPSTWDLSVPCPQRVPLDGDKKGKLDNVQGSDKETGDLPGVGDRHKKEEVT